MATSAPTSPEPRSPASPQPAAPTSPSIGLSSRARPFVRSEEFPPDGRPLSPSSSAALGPSAPRAFQRRSVPEPNNNGAAPPSGLKRFSATPGGKSRSLFRRPDVSDASVSLFSGASTSPGLGIRRMAEDFLSSLNDETPKQKTREIEESREPSAEQAGKSLERLKDLETRTVSPELSEWERLDEEMRLFSSRCAENAAELQAVRDDLVSRTRWAIRSVWPTADVDLVGSVAAGMPLPKSDLDFVIYFKPSGEAPPAFSYATSGQQENEMGSSLPFILLEGSGLDGSVRSQYFAHAATLLKLIGGRKKSKALFRSTKIQVFKDLNLIRLRDGLSGISIDLWFPMEPAAVTRSQRHTAMVRNFQEKFPEFQILACVLKSFLQQNLLSSGYSGLGSYGLILMILRFLQHHRACEQEEGRPAENNIGKLALAFFKLFVAFDYENQAIRVTGDGEFIEKPPVKPPGTTVRSLAHHEKRRTRQFRALNKSHSRGGLNQTVESAENSEEDEDGGGESSAGDSDSEGEEVRESTSAKKKRTLACEKFTLIIEDPEDDGNQIICNPNALKNLLLAFHRAIAILDPEHVESPASGESPEPGEDKETSAPIVNRSPGLSSRFAAIPLSTLASDPAWTSRSRFNRLIDNDAALCGPLLKACPSPACNAPGSSSRSMCPVQNKLCYSCGYSFYKSPPRSKNHSGHRSPATPGASGYRRAQIPNGVQYSSGSSTPNYSPQPPLGSGGSMQYFMCDANSSALASMLGIGQALSLGLMGYGNLSPLELQQMHILYQQQGMALQMQGSPEFSSFFADGKAQQFQPPFLMAQAQQLQQLQSSYLFTQQMFEMAALDKRNGDVQYPYMNQMNLIYQTAPPFPVADGSSSASGSSVPTPGFAPF